MQVLPTRTYTVTYRLEVIAECAEDAALAAAHAALSTRPQVFDVTPAGGGTVFIEVANGAAKRVA